VASEIADRLGYADPTSLSRARRRWFGEALSQPPGGAAAVDRDMLRAGRVSLIVPMREQRSRP
jgi:AraC-like DNA-binding protein